MKTIKEQIEVMQAFDDGKIIQVYSPMFDDWKIDETPSWNWHKFDYRIKPETKKRPMTFDEIVAYWKEHRTEIFTITKEGNNIEKGFITNIEYTVNLISLCDYPFDVEEFCKYVTKEDGTRFEIEE